MLQRIWPIAAKIYTGKRVVHKRPVTMLDVNRTSEEVTLEMDEHGIALHLDHKTAFELAYAIIERLPIGLYATHVVENKTAGERLRDLAQVTNQA